MSALQDALATQQAAAAAVVATPHTQPEEKESEEEGMARLEERLRERKQASSDGEGKLLRRNAVTDLSISEEARSPSEEMSVSGESEDDMSEGSGGGDRGPLAPGRAGPRHSPRLSSFQDLEKAVTPPAAAAAAQRGTAGAGARAAASRFEHVHPGPDPPGTI